MLVENGFVGLRRFKLLECMSRSSRSTLCVARTKSCTSCVGTRFTLKEGLRLSVILLGKLDVSSKSLTPNNLQDSAAAKKIGSALL